MFCTNRALFTGEETKPEAFHLAGGSAYTCAKQVAPKFSLFTLPPNQLASPGGQSQPRRPLLILSLAPTFSPWPPEIAPLK